MNWIAIKLQLIKGENECIKVPMKYKSWVSNKLIRHLHETGTVSLGLI